MAKEFVISLYLIGFKLVFALFRLLPLKNKVTFVVSFGQNSVYVYQEMLRQHLPFEVVFLYKKTCPPALRKPSGVKAVSFETANVMDFFKSIYHLATSKHVLVDNYFGFLSVVQFKEGVECIQLWHAVGAVKNFGLKDQSVAERSKGAQKRFLDVYEKFNKVVVGSEEMAKVFIQAFDLPSESILRTGIPRTDLFYDQNLQRRIISGLTAQNPALKEKKTILYAPTFRAGQLDHVELKLDLGKMQEALGEEYILLLRFHPAVHNHENYQEQYPGFVYDYSKLKDMNELLLVSDYLITDYSSIPYEFALLDRPMIFFAYDLESYQAETGLWDRYEESVPGPIARSTEDIVGIIRNQDFDREQIRLFSQKWNRYSVGKSSRNIVDYLQGKDSFLQVTGMKK